MNTERIVTGRIRRTWGLGWVAALAMTTGAGAQMLELESRAVVSGAFVLLQDIVRSGTKLPEGWGNRSIAEAPRPKEVRVLSLTDVAQAMNEYEDMRHVVLRGRTAIHVSVKHRPVEIEQIQKAIDRYVEANPDWQDRRLEVMTEQADVPHVPGDELQMDVMAIVEGTEKGRYAAQIQFKVDGEAYGEKPLVVEVEELRPYWAAARPLERGATLTTDILSKQWISDRDASRYYSADRPVAGMELRRSVQAGQLLAMGMLAQPVYARRGEVVRVVSNRGGLTVTLRAKALSDGRRDQRILCLNEQSGRRMHVRMVRPRGGLLEEESGDSAT